MSNTYKSGDNVTCVDRGTFNYLTEGNQYVIENTNAECDELYIRDNNKVARWFFARRFKLVTPDENKSKELLESITLAQSFIGKKIDAPQHGGKNTTASKVVVYLPGHDFGKYGSLNAQNELTLRGFSVCITTSNGMEYPVSTVVEAKLSSTIKLTSDYDAVIYADRVEVSCQTISREKLLELVKIQDGLR